MIKKCMLEDQFLRCTDWIKKALLPIAVLTTTYLLSFFSILRADFYYVDDMARAISGIAQWDHFSRYLSNFFSKVFSTGGYLTDVSPLTQIVACIFLALTGIISLYIISGKMKFSAWQYIAATFFGLTPYFLECISYKYDSAYMAFSVFISVFPILFYNKNKILYGFIVLIGTLMMCMTYQASSGIFPMLVVLIMLKMWNNKESTKKILTFFATSAGAYLIGLLIFKVFIMREVDDYASGSTPALSQLIPTIFENYKTFFSCVREDFRLKWIGLAGLIGVGFIYSIVRDSKQNKIISAVVAGIAATIMALLCFGAYPFLTSPLVAPRAMYGLGALIAFWAIYVASSKKVYWAKIVSFVLCWMFVVFAFSYGNALTAQKTYTDYRICATIDDLIELDLLDGEEIKEIQIIGTIGQAPQVRNMPGNFQMMNKLVPITFHDSCWYYGKFGFENYYGLKNIKMDLTYDFTGLDLPVLEDNIYHTIKSDGKHILIELKK